MHWFVVVIVGWLMTGNNLSNTLTIAGSLIEGIECLNHSNCPTLVSPSNRVAHYRMLQPSILDGSATKQYHGRTLTH
jgi:hypothetical protein